MTDTYKIVLFVEGQDKASGPLNAVQNALGGIGTVAGGILTAGLLYKIGDAIAGFAQQAWDAVGSMQSLKISLETLAAAELINTGVTSDFSTALAQAGPKAQELLGWLRELSFASPFTYETIAQAFQFNVSFGQTTDLAKISTKAMIDYAAAVGLSAPEFERLAYALAQTSAAGKITAADIRQFSNSRFGVAQLNQVFKEMSKATGVVINDYKDFNDAVASGAVKVEDFYKAFGTYVDRAYVGAAGRMTRTLPGIMSNLSDIMFFSLGDAFGASGQVLADFMLPYIDQVIAMIKTGELQDLGKIIADNFKQAIGTATEVMGNLMTVFNDLKAGNFKQAIDDLFKPLFNVLPFPVVLVLRDFARTLLDIGTYIQDNVLPRVKELSDWLGKQLNDALISTHINWKDFTAGVAGAAAVLVGAGLIDAVIGLAVALAALNWPLILLAGLVGLISAAWSGDWWNIREIVANVVMQLLIYFTAAKIMLADLWARWQPTVQAIGDIFVGLWAKLQPVLTELVAKWTTYFPRLWQAIQPLGEALQNLWTAIGPVLLLIGTVLASVLFGVINGIASATSAFLTFFPLVLQGIVTVVSGIINFVSGIIDVIVGIFTLNGPRILDGFKMMGLGIMEVFLGAFTAIFAYLGLVLGQILGFISGFISGVIGFFQTLWDVLVGHSIIPDMLAAILLAFTTTFTNLLDTLLGWVNKIIEFFTGMVTDILAVFTGTDWLTIGQNIVQGIAAGITSALDWIKDAATAAAQAALDAAKAALGINSPSLIFKQQVGFQMAAGMAGGLTDGIRAMTSQMQMAVAGIAPSLQPVGGFAGGQLSMQPRSSGLTQVIVNINTALNTADGPKMRAILEPIVTDINRKSLK